jgi:hypothetical protein
MKRLTREDLEQINLLKIAPVRLAEWEEEKGSLTIIRPKPARRGIGATLQWLQYWLAHRG